jgi:hypothetical protein
MIEEAAEDLPRGWSVRGFGDKHLQSLTLPVSPKPTSTNRLKGIKTLAPAPHPLCCRLPPDTI